MEVSINGGSTCTVSLFGLSETVEHYQLRNPLLKIMFPVKVFVPTYAV